MSVDTSQKYLLMLRQAEMTGLIPGTFLSLDFLTVHQAYCPEHLQITLGTSCSDCPRNTFRPILIVEDLNELLNHELWSHFPSLEKFLLFCKDNRRRFHSNEQYLLAYYMKSYHKKKWVPSVKAWLEA